MLIYISNIKSRNKKVLEAKLLQYMHRKISCYHAEINIFLCLNSMSSKICAPSKKLKTEQTSLKTSQLQVRIIELVQIWSVIQNQYALSIDTKLNF